MTDYINVPVPSALVPSVYRLIADHQAGAETGGVQGAVTVDANAPREGESRDWSRREMETLAAADAPSVKVFCEVLDLLAEISPQGMSISAIGEHFAVEGLTLQKKFGPVTRWMKTRVEGGPRWPIHFAPTDDWYMNEHNARLWKQVRG